MIDANERKLISSGHDQLPSGEALPIYTTITAAYAAVPARTFSFDLLTSANATPNSICTHRQLTHTSHSRSLHQVLTVATQTTTNIPVLPVSKVITTIGTNNAAPPTNATTTLCAIAVKFVLAASSASKCRPARPGMAASHWRM